MTLREIACESFATLLEQPEEPYPQWLARLRREAETDDGKRRELIARGEWYDESNYTNEGSHE